MSNGAGLAELYGFVRRVATHPSSAANRAASLLRFVRRQTHKRWLGRPLVVTWEGLRLIVHPDAHSAAAAYYLGRADYWELTFLERFLRPGDLVVDVGANVGVYSLFLARYVGLTGAVLACEPDPANLRRLRQHASLNRLAQITVVASAIGDRDGRACFDVGRDTIGSLVDDGGDEVPITTLDHVVGSGAPVYIKVDVEGFEDVVLGGARELMARGWPLVWQVELFRTGGHPVRLRMGALLAEYGYRYYAYNPRSGELEERDEPRCTENLFAIADLEAVRRRLAS